MPYLPFRRTRLLTPGAGFGGATGPIADVGSSGRGYLAQPAARWTDVPYQVRTGSVRVGVAAFHINGINRVEFIANGGAAVSVSAMARNPDTGLDEYYATLDLTGVSDGLIEIRAIVYPNTAGTPRVLEGDWRPSANEVPHEDGEHAFFLWSNTSGTYTRTPLYISPTGNDSTGNGTLGTPYLTLGKCTQVLHDAHGSLDGCEVRCAAGTYSFSLTKSGGGESTATNRWFTIAAASGVAATDVILQYGADVTPKLVRFSGVTCMGTATGQFFTMAVGGECCWLSNGSRATNNLGRGTLPDVGFWENICGRFITESSWVDLNYGPQICSLLRNVTITTIAEDVVSRSGAVFNLTVSDVAAEETEFHSDYFQLQAADTYDNIVHYGVRITNAQAQMFLFQGPTLVKNSAFVNMMMDGTAEPGVYTQFNCPMSHIMFLNMTLKQAFLFNAGSVTVDTHCAFVGNVFSSVVVDPSDPPLLVEVSAAKWESNHFVTPSGYGIYAIGTDQSSGAWATIVEDDEALDFTPISASPLLDRFTRIVPTDVAGTARPTTCAVGAYEIP